MRDTFSDSAGTDENPPTPDQRESQDVFLREIEHPGMLSSEHELKLGQKWLLIAGIITTILAVGYFLKYSFDQNWIGPIGRVALAYATSLTMLGIGETLRRRGLRIFGLYLIGGSVAVAYFSCYAAFQLYHLIGYTAAFGNMVLITCGAGTFAVIYNNKWLAVLGTFGGFLTPVILNTATNDQLALMMYMTILNGGVLAIGLYKQWDLLNRLACTFTWLLFSTWFFKYYDDSVFKMTITFLNVFFLIHALIPFAFFLRNNKTGIVAGLGTNLINTIIAFAYSFYMIENYAGRGSMAIVTLAYAAIFSSMAYVLYRLHPDHKEPVVLLAAKAGFFCIITIPIYFSAHWISVFWALQGLALIWAWRQLGHEYLRHTGTTLLLIAFGKVFTVDYFGHFQFQIPGFYFAEGFHHEITERWLTQAVALTTLWFGGRMSRNRDVEPIDTHEDLRPIFYGLFTVVLFLAANMECAAYFYDVALRARFAAISILWAVFAISMMTLGFIKNLKILRQIAIALFMITIVKVFFHDMANVETPYRILSFLIVGVLLIVTSYFYHRFSERISAKQNLSSTETAT